jgi:hypothetical protein
MGTCPTGRLNTAIPQTVGVTDETTVRGDRKSVDLGDVEGDLAIEGDRVSVSGTLAADAVTLSVRGEHTSVTLHGDGGTVELVHEGTATSVTTAPEIDVVTERDDGSRLSVDTDERLSVASEPEDLIRRHREEAYSNLGWFGYGSVRYQTDASDQPECRYCGREADDIVHRHEERLLVVFGLPITVERGAVSDECEYCSVAVGDASLTEAERRRIFD